MVIARRILWLACLVAGMPGVAPCQAGGSSADTLAGAESRLSLGMRLGMAGANLSMNNLTYTPPRLAPIAGVYAEVSLNQRLSLVLDVLYTEYGGNGVNPLFFYGRDSLSFGKLTGVDIRTMAVEVPLQMKLRFASAGVAVPYVSVGASGAWAFSTTSNNTVVRSDTTQQFGLNMDSEIHRFHVAALGALGVEIRGAHLTWSVEGFYRLGVSEFDRSSVAGTSGYSANAAGVKFGFVL